MPKNLDRLIPLFLFLLSTCVAAQPAGDGSGSGGDRIGKESRQILLVTTHGWDSTFATLQRYERTRPGEGWHPVGTPMPAIVGRNGLAAGGGLPRLEGGGRAKHEGDGRAPAGRFLLGPLFGYAPPGALGPLLMPYVQLTPGIECVDDTMSPRYNSIADTTKVTEEWHSSEAMSRAGKFYEWGIVVRYNTDPVVPGNGSCIFIHVWGGPSVTTSGCTALDSANVVELLRWLDAAKHPMLVQVPEEELIKSGLRERFPRPGE